MAEFKQPKVNDQRHADLTQMGVSAEAAQAWMVAQEIEGEPDAPPGLTAGTEPLAVWPENWPVLGLFLRLQTQWVKGPDGGLQGLRYEAAAAAMSMLDMPDRASTFDHLVQMEHAALEAIHGV